MPKTTIRLAMFFCIATLAVSQDALAENKGVVHVETVRYLSYEQGKVKENQIQNNAMRPILLEQGVSEIFTEEIIHALSSMGLTVVSSSDRTVQGTIKTLSVDDSGPLVDYRMKIGFELLTGKNKNSVYSKSFTSFRRQRKAPFARKMASRMIRDCVKNFVRDARKKGVL